jgi:hypothetical protein
MLRWAQADDRDSTAMVALTPQWCGLSSLAASHMQPGQLQLSSRPDTLSIVCIPMVLCQPNIV